eukprot:scaffold113378_cov23-Tisochrysis_lutea.AAC.2
MRKKHCQGCNGRQFWAFYNRYMATQAVGQLGKANLPVPHVVRKACMQWWSSWLTGKATLLACKSFRVVVPMVREGRMQLRRMIKCRVSCQPSRVPDGVPTSCKPCAPRAHVSKGHALWKGWDCGTRCNLSAREQLKAHKTQVATGAMRSPQVPRCSLCSCSDQWLGMRAQYDAPSLISCIPPFFNAHSRAKSRLGVA